MEPEIGEIRIASDGNLYQYMGGGDWKDKANWKPVLAGTSPEAEASAGGVGDYLRLGLHGVSQGLSDEIVGWAGGDADASRERIARLREMPGAGFTEFAGGMLLPGGVGAKAGRYVVGKTASKVAGALAGGGATGLALGATAGAAEAEPGARLPGAILGGGVGGTLGAVTGGLGAGITRAGKRVAGDMSDAQQWAGVRLREILEDSGVKPEELLERVRAIGPQAVVADIGHNAGRQARASRNYAPALDVEGGPVHQVGKRSAGAPTRVARDLRSASGLPGTYDESLTAAENAVEAVREKYYRPLARELTRVDGENIRAALEDPAIAAAVGRYAPEVLEGKRPPSFLELQDAFFDLRDDATELAAKPRGSAAQRASAAAERLENAMMADIPEFRPAQRAYAVAIKTKQAHEAGRKMANKPVSDIQREMAKYPPEAHDAFRQGLLDASEVKLREGSGRTTNRIIDADPGFTPEDYDRLRIITGGDEGMKLLYPTQQREFAFRRTANALGGNSTSLMQAADMGASFIADTLPSSKRDAFWRIVGFVAGLGPAEQRAAHEILGRVLLSDGEQAAEMMAKKMALKNSLFGGAGGALGAQAGAAAGRQTNQGGGLFD